jgi:L-ascorbate metabolism protein UlaG (beta-lactamase superfamily)
MTVWIRFLGVAAYEIRSGSRRILIDPFLDGNPASPLRAEDLDRVDLVLVTHAAFDHLGDTEAIARRTGAPVVCGGEVKTFLVRRGIPTEQVRATTWGISVEVAGIRVHPVECHHWSQIELPDGSFLSGLPMGFIVDLDDGVRFYHYGDTALFSDLRLIGELYRPTVGCVGVTQPQELLSRIPGPGRVLTGEMGPREAALAARWLGLRVVLPCHYLDPDCPEVREFCSYLASASACGEPVPDVRVLKPGEGIAVGAEGVRDAPVHG